MNLLAPVMAGITALVAGLAILVWMHRNRPQLRVPSVTPRSEEEAQLPFEDSAIVDGPRIYANSSIREVMMRVRETSKRNGPLAGVFTKRSSVYGDLRSGAALGSNQAASEAVRR